MFCKKCGADVGDAKFCPNCGEDVSASEGNAPCYVEGEKMVNKIAYGLIAIFIGCLGIHRFYAGRPVSGIIYIAFDILTLGLGTIVTGLLGLVEGIIALCRPDDGHGNIPVIPGKFFV